MCGIVGFSAVNAKDPVAVLVQHLAYLEYRGYDSTGMAFVDTDGAMHVAKKVGNINALRETTKDLKAKAHFGIGHTRWATHGEPSDINAHPHKGQEAVIVHNGIIENHQTLKAELVGEGFEFISDTDSEIIAHYITRAVRQGLPRQQIFQNFHKDLHGTFAIVALFNDGDILATRYKSPLVFCKASDGLWVASDALAIAQHSADGTVYFMKDGEVLQLSCHPRECEDPFYHGKEMGSRLRGNDSIEYTLTKNNVTVLPLFTPIERRHQVPDKKGYAHFMLKEMHEQVEVLRNLRTFLENYDFPLQRPKKLLILGCGTSYYAGLIASYWLQDYAQIETDVRIASEFRYQHFIRDYDLCICISQSGETIDVVAALEILKLRGVKTIGLLNVLESTIGQMVDVLLPICAGPEIGVASTKALLANLMCLLFITLNWTSERQRFFDITNDLPALVQEILDQAFKVENMAERFYTLDSVFFIGRHQMYPVCLEGALKLKELSYINANAYPAGELKHGPIALIDANTLTVVCTANDHVSDKTLSNAQEVMARQGKVLHVKGGRIADSCHSLVEDDSKCQDPLLSAFAPIVTLQLFSYYMALKRGCAIDQPRNLAKAVTVE